MGQTIDLKEFGLPALRSAIRSALSAASTGLPSSERLERAAQAVLTDGDSETSAYFQSMLELGYLVASADGFAEEERHALAELLEAVTGSVVAKDALELHFRDLDDAVEMLGRHERLRRAAADFEDGLNRSEAIGFAALVALADGKIADQEIGALHEIGGYLGLEQREVDASIERVVSDLQQRLSRQG